MCICVYVLCVQCVCTCNSFEIHIVLPLHHITSITPYTQPPHPLSYPTTTHTPVLHTIQVSREFKCPEGRVEEDMGAAGDGELLVVLDLVPDAELLQVSAWGGGCGWGIYVWGRCGGFVGGGMVGMGCVFCV